MLKRNFKQVALATSAAALFALGGCASQSTSSTSAASAESQCMGVNACKGHGDCKTAANACGGKNACKSQGFVMLDKATCDQVGGTHLQG